MRWYVAVLKKYWVISGRARRKEYWIFFLFNLLIVIGLGFVEGFLYLWPELDEGVLGTIYQLAVFIPSITVGVRRMHDTDHNGWWILFPIVNLILACKEGQKSVNRFGPDPKATAGDESNAAGAAGVEGFASPTKTQPQSQTLMAFCIRCGTRFPEIAAYCQKCGAPRTT